jgi:tRNA G10  N-methylase Trm11
MHIRPIHPFPARMAPDLALSSLETLRSNSIVLDPMVGSGTVLRQAVALGHNAIGFDMDPLAVLMTRVWTTGISPSDIRREYSMLVKDAQRVDLRSKKLPWVAESPATAEFIKYWFGDDQRRTLQRLAYVLYRRRQANLGSTRQAAVDAITVALSRIIITKEQGASLARDVSHSRPHKVADDSDYDVLAGFERSVAVICERAPQEIEGRALVQLGDAREIPLRTRSVDAVLTSPPYLNAIDYMRGHRLSLVWLGYKVEDLRSIRANSIGSERAQNDRGEKTKEVSRAMFSGNGLPGRFTSMIQRYANDLIAMTSEVSRVLKKGGVAIFVVGNSCLKDSFIKNSEGVSTACRLAGLSLVDIKERDLPPTNRYLPITVEGSLSKRMRTELILTFSNT